MKVVTIGRSFDNDVVINDFNVSRHHCQIILHDDGKYSLSDFGSTNGTYVNGQRVCGEIKLSTNDIVKIGTTILTWGNYFKVSTHPTCSAHTPIKGNMLSIGRNSDNNIVLNDHNVSRHHCQIVQHGNGTFSIIDLGSTNGTFVNGQQVFGEMALNLGDRVEAASVEVSWQSYFKPQVTKRKKKWLWPTVAAVAAAVVAVIVGLVYDSSSDQAYPFEREYPDAVTVELVDDEGVPYTVEAIEGQVCVWFNENVSFRDAKRSIKELGGTIVAQVPDFGYYLVEIPVNNVQEFITNINNVPGIERAFPNMISYACSANAYILDNYFPGMDQTDTTPHGVKVQFALQEYGKNVSLRTFNIGQKNGKNTCKEDKLSTICINTEFFALDTISMLNNDGPIFINMSYGPALPKRETSDGKPEKYYWDSATKKEREKYQFFYINSIQKTIQNLKTLEGKDYIVVIAAGNEGVKFFNENIISYLRKNLHKKDLEIMDRHFLLVTADETNRVEKYKYQMNRAKIKLDEAIFNNKESLEKDWKIKKDKYEFYKTYSNEMEDGHYDPWVTKVDISDFEYKGKERAGTSYAAPRVVGILSSVANEKNITGVEVLELAREVTKRDKVLTKEALLQAANDKKTVSSKEVTIEGVLNMHLLDNNFNDNIIYQYQKTDWVNNYVAFVVSSNKSINVLPYLEEGDEELIDDEYQSSFMVVPEFKYNEKDFADKYANNRVRATGTLYVVGGGWRNATFVIMKLRSIELLDEDKNIENREKRQDLPNDNQNKYQTSQKKEYKYKMSCSKQLFESKTNGHIDLPNGDVINYQYRKGNDSDLRYSYGSCYYIRFTMANNESICKKYCILAKDETNDDRLWGGSGNPWDDEFLSIKPIDLPIYSESNQRFNAKSDNVFVIISQY